MAQQTKTDEHATPATPAAAFPANWRVASDFDPNDQMMNLKGKDYLNVQSRMVWFIRDQRALIIAGLARQPYATLSELVELDRQTGWAHFKSTVRDVLGNESVAYGSESLKDFGDYIEKAATKSLGRALVGLGYGTGMAPEMDEGERVVDSPIERERKPAPPAPAKAQQSPQPAQAPVQKPAQPAAPAAPAAPDRYAKALAHMDVLQLLNKLGRRNEEDRRAELKAVFNALEDAHKTVNIVNIVVALQTRLDDLDAMTAVPSLEAVNMGAPGN